MPTVPKIDTKFHPSTDFYNYVNHTWQSHVHIPPFRGNYGVSEEIEDDVRDELVKLIESLRTKQPNHPISKIATSFLTTSVQKTGVMDLQRLLGMLECMNTADDIGFQIGVLNKLQIRSPISLVVERDVYKSSEYRISLYEPKLGLPEKQLYREDATPKSILPLYSKIMASIGKYMHLESLESVVDIETALLPSLSKGYELDTLSFSYNPHTYGGLVAEYPSIPWKRIFEGWGLTGTIDSICILTNKRFFHKMNTMFESFPIAKWKTWMRAMIVLSFLEYLPPPFDDYEFELYDKALQGNTQKMPQKFLTLNVLQTFAPHDLGKLFVQHFVPRGTKAYALRMVKSLQHATVERLKHISWMSQETNIRAIQKVKAMKFQVAYPDTWYSDTHGLEIQDDRPIQNILLLSANDTVDMIQQLHGKKEDRWEDGVFEVNAYYYSESNTMVIPAGILRKPFFDLRRSIAWNLGGIGAAIGHEITHGFDIEGRMYDLHGNFKNWWTDSDVTHYKRITKSLVELFDDCSYMGGKVDGELTLSENMADLGGLAIALHALQTKMGKATDSVMRKAYQDFFTSYAVSWRNKDRATKAKHSLFQDVHAPAPLRVNMIVRQFEEFYVAFNISSEDPGYIPKEKRIVMW